MQFFNQKEEVIDIQLTQFGKSLLSQGRFKPTYYAFYDNDILYDLNYANASGSYKETQNQTEKRILKETPRLKTQYMFESSMRPTEVQWHEHHSKRNLADFSSQGDVSDINQDGVVNFTDFRYYLKDTIGEYGKALTTGGELQLTFDRNYSLGMPIGTMKLGSEYTPAWEIDFLYGKMNNYEAHHTGSGTPLKIPQLNAEIDYEVFTVNLDPNTGSPKRSYIPKKLLDIAEFSTENSSIDIRDGDASGDNEFGAVDEISTNSARLEIVPDFLLLELEEKNTDFLKDNFELEVFEIIETEKDPQTGAIITQDIPLEFYTSGELGPQHVEYWFDLSVDEDIESMYFCASDIVADRKKNKLADAKMRYPEDCPEFDKTTNMYQEEVYEQEEPC